MTAPAALERYRPLVDDWSAFCAALARPLPSCLFTNQLRISPEALQRRLGERGIETEPLSWRPEALRVMTPGASPGKEVDYMLGLYQIQEEASLLPTLLLDAQPGERVLDLCAAPGGKTVHLALAMQGRGTVIANDVNIQRVRAIRAHVDRLGLTNVVLTRQSADTWPNKAGTFDRVLADVPCSCLGTSRKSSAADREERTEGAAELHRQQLAILRRALAVCRPGGRVVYSTCTYAPEENECVIDAALQEFSESARLLHLRPAGFRVADGVTHWQGQALHPSLANALRIWPHHNDTGGFFVAVFEKLVPAALAARSAEPAPATEAADAEPWLATLQERFAFAPEALQPYICARPNRKYLSLISRELQAPVVPEPISAGILLLRSRGRYPKPTTAASQLLGPLATRNVIELVAEQVTRYVQREPLRLGAAQLQCCDGTGYVLLNHGGLTYGTGVLRMDDDGHGELESMFPVAHGGTSIHVDRLD